MGKTLIFAFNLTPPNCHEPCMSAGQALIPEVTERVPKTQILFICFLKTLIKILYFHGMQMKIKGKCHI